VEGLATRENVLHHIHLLCHLCFDFDFDFILFNAAAMFLCMEYMD
jgi:hypothetical protein